MEFGKRHETTDTTNFCPRQLEHWTHWPLNLLITHAAEELNIWIQVIIQLVTDLLRWNWCDGLWPLWNDSLIYFPSPHLSRPHPGLRHGLRCITWFADVTVPSTFLGTSLSIWLIMWPRGGSSKLIERGSYRVKGASGVFRMRERRGAGGLGAEVPRKLKLFC